MNQIWWGSLSPIEHIYWIIAIAATTILAVQLIIVCFSGLDFHIGSDLSHGDVTSPGHDISMPHFQMLTIRNIVAFFALFGWSGLAFYHHHLPLWSVILLSFSCGFAMMMITAAIFWGLSKMQSSGNVDYNSAKGLQATVYLKIPPSGAGSGQIKVSLQGKFVEMEALATGVNEIPTGSSVIIKEITDSKALVERIGV
jgi:hypothetical protein